ncbi:type VII toxin-antitoxin system HepT family RNase toxin [Thermococcus gammatolerans]|uniref:Nucleotidyltransferase substrate binding subunit, putative n=1 Tax=Thermococcus gammatolerans (strain DSM 15229 / JCM 11827 / EJ3) TaxID=593117 RepID=C5A5H6_THEGJ|nr:DUF86 domain-containing protein [Thermococcus gammatolerans]ACS33488.1 Nucleotidyltransferase substrate binding subunit, putative [Thermococcus gammatolerans EJ3]
MEIDRELVERRLAEIKGALVELGEIVRAGKEEFLSNSLLRNAAKYLLITAIEGAFSVCNHISVRMGRVPKSYADCFKTLAELGVVEKDLAERLARMARFRNVLVHRYWRIDDELVFEIMKKDTRDLEEFVRAVGEYVKRQ